MRPGVSLLGSALLTLFLTRPAWAQSSNSDLHSFTTNTLQIITLVATLASTFFIIKGGYQYITSTGNPDAISDAKRTIRNALLGLLLVLAANVLTSVFRQAITSQTIPTDSAAITLTPVTSAKPGDGLTQVLIDAISGFLQNIIESATKPLIDGIFSFLTSTPTLFNNSVIRQFWLVILGITDTLFVIIVALLGLGFMSASTFGFEEMEFKHLLPRIGLAFLGANVSLFLADYAIIACNTLTKTVLDSTGGLNHAWVENAVNPSSFITGATPLITLIFLLLFLILSIVLLIMYISRLILISLGAVLSPLVCMAWVLPKFSNMAEIAIKTYLTTVFISFIHVVVIQLASSFLIIPNQDQNALISIAVGIGLFATLLKVPNAMMQLVFYSSSHAMIKNVGSHVINVLTSSPHTSTPSLPISARNAVKLPRKVVNL